jgi:hypothetical protein
MLPVIAGGSHFQKSTIKVMSDNIVVGRVAHSLLKVISENILVGGHIHF